MKSSFLFVLGLALVAPAAVAAESASARPYGLVIHGGAGVILRRNLSPELEAQYRAGLDQALQAGYAVLDRGGSALDAVNAAINVMEDSPLFNAGKGAVLNAEGQCELDASIMDGRTLAAGAVAGLHHIKNPINLARDVMTRSPHVMLIGDGAEKFAAGLGYAMMPPEYFITDFRRKQLEEARRAEQAKAPQANAAVQPAVNYASSDEALLARQRKYGTVGCVALDKAGNLAAGTSTGGMTNKKYGRVGDVPIIGAGTYASNATCGVSSTGWGEFFIRATVAHDISAQVEYQGKDLAAAAKATLAKVAQMGGDGGVICLDARGHVAMEFNSPGMYRAYRLSDRPAVVAIYGDEAGK
jgi:beta-aspartyl-peptidase (threonine type)